MGPGWDLHPEEVALDIVVVGLDKQCWQGSALAGSSFGGKRGVRMSQLLASGCLVARFPRVGVGCHCSQLFLVDANFVAAEHRRRMSAFPQEGGSCLQSCLQYLPFFGCLWGR